ncbi:aldehyde dehydrogenase [Candidatus Roizmanbacteria bacterium]|nr:aldehyde dehydrogenase [Candidatus Roizmanbacteria bacterium]
MLKLVSTNPAKNYKVIGSVNISTKKEVKQKVIDAQKAKAHWKELGVKNRIGLLWKIYYELKKVKKEIALITTKEIGKPIKESLEDIDWDLSYFKWFLENGESILKDEITFKDKNIVHRVVYEPNGVTAVIVPWNYPFSMFVWGTIPNLVVGNTVILKHSEECPLTGKLIEEIINKSNFPRGVFSEIYGDGKIGQQLVEQNIDLIWFTGSTNTGKKLYKIASKKFIRAVMEMGGSNPAIVFSDIDIDDVVNRIYYKRYMNCGQACDALKRLIVHDSIFDRVVTQLKQKVELTVVGDPEDEKTQMGPLVAKRQLDLLESQVDDAVKKGAKIITGGKKPENLRGAYYLPTILTNVKRNMRVWKEEVFGPVLSVVTFKSEQEAIKLANDTNYGLGAYIFSRDTKRAIRIAPKINAGTVDINKGDHWKPCNPFGGYKDSGLGREHGKYGFYDLCQLKVVAIG